MTLHLADALRLPLDLATHVTLIAGKRGSGKTNTAKRLVEQMHRGHVPFGVLDPVDVWWGLKAGRDGDGAGGLDGVYIFGGRHAEYPLAPTGGPLMADLFVDYRISAVMEMREWSGADRARFVTAFAHRLLERNTEPFVLVAEEAHDLMPQQAMGEEKGSLGAMLRLVKLGRSGGIGMLELTQRLAALNKTATTQADVLVMHRTTGPQDRKALNDWIAEHHASDEERDAFLRALPELKTGEAFVWAPDFPEDKPLGLLRTRILECQTFNSHATPKVGEKRSEPKQLRPADLARLAKAMAATVEKAKQDDPAELRRTILTLRRELSGAQKAIAPTRLEIKQVERAVLKEGQLDRAYELEHSLESAIGRAEVVIEKLREAIVPVASALRAVAASTDVPTAVRAARSEPAGEPRPRAALGRNLRGREAITPAARTTEGITARQQRFLDAAATLETLGVEATRETVAGWLGVHPRGGSVGEELKALVDAGLIEYARGRITVTDIGRSSAGEASPDEAIDRAIRGLSPRQARIFEIIRQVHPDYVSREDIARSMTSASKPEGIHPRGGSLGEDLGRLRGRGLIDYERGRARLRDFLVAGQRL